MDEEWRRKLQQSEAKRAELVMENHRLKEQVETLRMSASSPPRASPARGQPPSGRVGDDGPSPPSLSIAGLFASPIRGGHADDDALESARRQIEALEGELHRRTMQLAAVQQRHQLAATQGSSSPPNHSGAAWMPPGDDGGRDAIGFVSIAPIPQASEQDYGFAEEDHAKECAEEIMARLLRALHTQRDAQERLAAAQLQNVRLQSLLDESRGREVVLSQMMGAYSDVVNSSSPEGGNASTRPGSAIGTQRINHNGATTAQQPQHVEEYLQQCMHNLGRLDGVKRRLIDEKLREVLDENAKLKELCQHQQGEHHAAHLSGRPTAGSMRAGESGPAAHLYRTGAAADATAVNPQQPALLSDERTLLMALLEREKEYQRRMEQLKRLVLDKEKSVQELRKMLQANVARINNVR